MRITYIEVDFQKYCPLCKYSDLEGHEDPCNDCLDAPYNAESEQPVEFKEKE